MLMSESPPANGANGVRDAPGRSRQENSGWPGSPFATKVARIRASFLNSVSEDDIRAIVGKMVELAKGGNLAVAREILQRTIGNVDPLDLTEGHFLHRLSHALGNEHSD
jgi:hypothetical protein